MKDPARARGTAAAPSEEPRWHASLAVVAILALYITLPARLTFGPVWLFLVLVLGILIPLSIFRPSRHRETTLTRAASIALIVIVNVFNVISVLLLVHGILFHRAGPLPLQGSNTKLLIAGSQIWLTNILVFALWFWETDAGGPEPRAHCTCGSEFVDPDFLFPQNINYGGERQNWVDPAWKPLFVDYLYLAFTNSLAFSPADTFPVTRPAKLLMALEATISFVTIAIVVARAVGAIT